MEAALAHKMPNAVEAAYARTDHFERRRALKDEAWDLVDVCNMTA